MGLGVHVGARRQQRVDRRGPAAAARPVQRGPAAIGLGVNVGTGLQQRVNRLGSAVAARPV